MALHLEKKAKGEKSWDDEEQVKNSQKQNRKKNPNFEIYGAVCHILTGRPNCYRFTLDCRRVKISSLMLWPVGLKRTQAMSSISSI